MFMRRARFCAVSRNYCVFMKAMAMMYPEGGMFQHVNITEAERIHGEGIMYRMENVGAMYPDEVSWARICQTQLQS